MPAHKQFIGINPSALVVPAGTPGRPSTGGAVPFSRGWDDDLDLGISATYVVASDGSANFTTVQAAINQLVADAVPGTIRVRDKGAHYREKLVLTGLAGVLGNRVKILGYGTEKPTISGQEVLTGLTVCDSGDEATVGPNFASIYKTTVTKAALAYTNFVSLNICEAGEQIHIATDRNDTTDLFWSNDEATFHVADAFGLDGSNFVTSITDATVFAAYTQTQVQNAKVIVYVNPNSTVTRSVTAYNAGTHVATIASTSPNPVQGDTGTPAADDLRYSLINILPAMAIGSWGFVDGGGATITVYVRPLNAAHVTSGITYAARKCSIDTGLASHIEIAGLRIVGGGSDGSVDVNGIGNLTGSGTAKSDIRIHQCYVGQTANLADLSYGGVYFSRIDGLEVDYCTFDHIQNGHAGWAGPNAGNSANVRFHHNDCDYIGKAPFRLYGTLTGGIEHNAADHAALGAHGNAGNAYEGCDAILFGWNKFGANVRGYFTWQETSNVAFIGNVLSDSGANGDGRAFVDQLHASAGPPNAPSTAWILCNTAAPKSNTLAAVAAAFTISNSVSDTQQQSTIISNNVGGGITWTEVAQVALEKNNYLYRLALTYDASTTFDARPEVIFEDYLAGDYRPPAGSPVLSAAARNHSSLLPTFAANWPWIDWNNLVDAYGLPFTLNQVGGTTTPVADSTAPALSSLGGTPSGLDVLASVSSTEGRGTLYWVLEAGTGAPTANQIIAGLNSSGAAAPDSGNQRVSATGTQNLSASGLVAGTHRLHAVQVDLAGNVSSVANSASITLVSYVETFVTFDGVNDRLRKTADLTGAVDNKMALFFAAVDFTNIAAASEYILAASNTTFRLRRNSTGTISLLWGAASVSTAATAGAERANILGTLDADGTSRVIMWLESTGAWGVGGTDATSGGVAFDLTPGSWALCSTDAAGLAGQLAAGVARVAMWTGVAPDITNAAVRNNFSDPTTGVTVDPATSIAAYGTPLIDFYGAAATWNAGVNHGSGGNFTMAGAVA